MENPIIRNCPFCGCEGKLIIIESDSKDYYEVNCISCYASSDSYQDKIDAVSAWNTRIGDC